VAPEGFTYANEQRSIIQSGSKVANYAKGKGNEAADDEDPAREGQLVCVLNRGLVVSQIGLKGKELGL
jgi:hypothetical protein